jgi:hypothetical protein
MRDEPTSLLLIQSAQQQINPPMLCDHGRIISALTSLTPTLSNRNRIHASDLLSGRTTLTPN